MTEDQKPAFLEMLVGVAEYYERQLTETTIKIYWHGLQKHDLSAVKRAFFNHTQKPENGQFMPKVADINAMLEGTSIDGAYIAWTKVDEAVRRAGVWSDVAFDDPIIHRVIMEMGGWIHLCGKKENEWPFIAKEFETRYRGYHIKRVAVEHPAILIGLAGAENRKNNQRVDPPILIGDAVKAQYVISCGRDLMRIEMKPASAQMVELVGALKHDKS